jgi:hypothetical protein
MVHDYVRYICTVLLAVCAVLSNNEWCKTHCSGQVLFGVAVVAAVASNTISFVSTSPSDRNLKTDLANGAVTTVPQNVPSGTQEKTNGV